MPLRLSPTWNSQIEAVPLTGLSTTTNAAVTATDSVLSAFGKLQAQCTCNAQDSGDIGRNKLLNGRFNVQQRGTGPWTTVGAYTADRWSLLLNVDSMSTSIIALADADRAALGDEYASAALQSVVAGTTTGFSQITQHIENVFVLSNKTVTVSFWAKASAALNIGTYFAQTFGTGGSPSATVIIAPVTIAVSTGWARYSTTQTLPSAAGKTLGTNGDNHTEFYFALSAGTGSASQCGVAVQSGTFEIWGVQIEIGPAMSSLENRPVDFEMMLCQRFYITQTIFLAGYAAAGGTAYGQFVFPVQMRGAPTVTFAGQTYTNASALTSVSVRATDLIASATVTAVGVGQATATLALTANI